MIHIRVLVLALALLPLPAGCAQKEPGRELKSEAGFVPLDRATPAAARADIPPEPGPGGAPRQAAGAAAGQVALPRMLVRTGSAVVQVTSLDSAVSAVHYLAAHAGGYIGGENVQSGSNQLRMATLQVMVPSARLDEAIAGLKPLGKVESVQVESQDVGEEYVDVNARLANQKRLEARLIALLDTRTGKLSDVLEVEHELARVREESDRLAGRSQYLERQVATSRLQVSVHEPGPVTGTTPGTNPIAHAFVQAWALFVGFLAALITSLGVVVPLALLIFLAWWAWSRIARGRPPIAPVAPIAPSTPPEESHGLGLR